MKRFIVTASILACGGPAGAQELVGMAPDSDAEYSPYIRKAIPIRSCSETPTSIPPIRPMPV